MSIILPAQFLEALQTQKPVTGLTHEFYRYPARFSPLFAGAAIQAFTNPGDIVFDPFVGGGTSLVEARALGRRAIGTDISSLAVFLSRVKTTPLTAEDRAILRRWATDLPPKLNLHSPAIPANSWRDMGYHRNIAGRATWHIRKTLELALAQLPSLPRTRQQQFARCVWLRTAQWALDCRTDIPTAKQLRQQFLIDMEEMLLGIADYSAAVTEADMLYKHDGEFRSLCLHRSAQGVETETIWANQPPPALILTSPPYPGVHVLYHRWQVLGRRETPAPFWIADSQDGNGEAFYTMGNRHAKNLDNYFKTIGSCFTSVRKLVGPTSLVVQLVAFSDPAWQLPRYLDTMAEAGFTEIHNLGPSDTADGRLWRRVPNRKEVVLFHQKRQE
jgi:hypothetical protein